MPEVVADVAGLLPRRACRNCMHTKVKCIPRSNQDEQQQICERCHRLGKSCTTPAPVARRKRPQHSSKVAQLEDRINRLSNLLTPTASPEGTSNNTINASITSDHRRSDYETASRQSDNSAESSHPTQPTTHAGDIPMLSYSSAKDREPNSRFATNDSVGRLSSVIAPPHLFSRDGLINTPADFYPMYMDPNLEQQLFEDYRGQWSQYLPFVPISPMADIQSMKSQRPFVYWCAIAIASMTRRDLNYALNEQLLKCFSEQLLVKSHKSLDALQGILILLAWYHYYSHMKPQTANLLHLAQALAIDLGFTRPSNNRHNVRIATDLADMYHGKQVVTGIQSSDDRRALLGLFWCTSRMSLCFPRIEPPSFSLHMDSCCRDLEIAMEFSSDIWLTRAVRLQQLIGTYHCTNQTSSELPLSFVKRALTRDLDNFVAELPVDMPQKALMLLEVEGCKFSLMGPGRSGNTGNTLESADLLHASLRAMDAFTSQLETCSPQEYISLPIWYFLISLISGLAEMCFLHAECWDLASVRKNFGFDILMQRHIKKLDECRLYGNEVPSTDLAWRFGLYAEKTRRSIKWYEAKIDLESKSAPAPVVTMTESGLPDLGASLFAELDDPIWDSIMGDWTQSFTET